MKWNRIERALIAGAALYFIGYVIAVKVGVV